MERPGYLILENGQVFAGARCGADGTAVGELVFTTGMGGYMETLSDPNYYGQMVIQTFPMMGAYGVTKADDELPPPRLKAFIAREIADQPSNFRSRGTLEAYMERQGIVGLSGVDTRAITRVLRDEGVMNACISANPTLSHEEWVALRNYRVQGAVEAVTCAETTTVGTGMPVVVWDFGVKPALIDELVGRGLCVTRVPAFTPAAQIAAPRPAAPFPAALSVRSEWLIVMPVCSLPKLTAMTAPMLLSSFTVFPASSVDPYTLIVFLEMMPLLVP